MTESINNAPLEDDVHYCQVHPDRDTELRCNRCNRYMCMQCAVRTPVGYSCKECVRGHEDKFFTGTTMDYIVVATVSAIGGALGAFLMTMIGAFSIISIIIAPSIGGGIGQLALSMTGRRRGRQSGYACAGGVLVGGLIAGFTVAGFGIGTLIFLALATPAAFASMKLAI